MQAQVGEWLVVEGHRDTEPRRQGRIVALGHEDGSPPYWVQWLDDDHRTLVFPGPDGRIEEHRVLPGPRQEP